MTALDRPRSLAPSVMSGPLFCFQNKLPTSGILPSPVPTSYSLVLHFVSFVVALSSFNYSITQLPDYSIPPPAPRSRRSPDLGDPGDSPPPASCPLLLLEFP